MTPRILDGTYVELWNVKAWRRKLGIGDEAPTLAQRIEVLVVGGSVDNANARLAAFSTLEETGYVVQTALSPPTFAGREIIGTPNQVNVANGNGIAGNTTLSLPQDIHTAAIPEFQTIRPTLLSPEFVTYVNAVGELDSTGVTADELNTIAAGTPGYFPYWLGTGGLASTSTIFTDGTYTGVGVDVLGTPITPDTPLHVWVQDFNHSAVTDLLKLDHYDPVGMAAGGGTGLLFAGSSDTVANRQMGRIQTRWTVAADATRASAMDFQTVDSGVITTHVKIGPTGNVGIGVAADPQDPVEVERTINSTVVFWRGTNLSSGTAAGAEIRLIGFDRTLRISAFNSVHTTGVATNSVRISTTDALRLDIKNQTASGVVRLFAGSATVIGAQLDGATQHFRVGMSPDSTIVPGARLHVYNHNTSDTVLDLMRLCHGRTTGAGAAGLGLAIVFAGESSTTDDTEQSRIHSLWTTATHATRTAAMEFQTVSAAVMATKMALSGLGGLSVGNATNTLPLGVINAVTGFRVNNAGTLGQVLMGDGTNIVLQALPTATHTILDSTVHTDSVTQTVTRGSLIYGNATPKWDELVIGSFAQYLRSNGTDVAWANLAASEITGTLPIGNGGTNNTTFTTNAVIFYNGTSLTDDGAAFTYQASGDNQLLLAKTLGVTQSDAVGYYALNSSGALAGAANQQWSPSFIWEGQGWGGSSQNVRYRAYVVPVDAATNPTGYWILERNINNLGYVELLRADSTGYMRITKDDLRSIDTTLAQSVFGLHLTNNTTSTGAITTQDAPPIIFKGQARNTTANTSHDWRWRMLMKGVTNAGTTRSYLRIDSGADASNFGNPIVMSSAGGLSVGALIEAAFGVVSAQVGFQIAGGASAGQFLVGNGTNFVSTVVSSTTFAHAMLSATHSDTLASAVSRGSLIVGNATPLWAELNIGAAARLLRSDGTDASWAQAVLTTDVTGILPIANGGTNASSFSATNGIVRYDGTRLVSSAIFAIIGNTLLGYDAATPTNPTVFAAGSTFDGIVAGAFSLENSSIAATSFAGMSIVWELSDTANNPYESISVVGKKLNSWTAVAATRTAELSFYLYTEGAQTLGLRLVYDNVVCGGGATSTTRVNDFLHIPSSTGNPTGVATEHASRVPMVYDTTNNEIFFYNPTDNTWRSVAVA